MKKYICMLLALLLLPACALAEFDNEGLERLDNVEVIRDFGTVDTVVRPANQPYVGEMADGYLITYLDFIELVDLEVTLVRFTVGIEVFEPVYADQIAITLDGKTYTIAAACEQTEYDGVYMEDYTFCLTDESLPLLLSMARQKQDEMIPVTFIYEGSAVITGGMLVPGDDAAWVYDRYIDLGGKGQDVAAAREEWPCRITTAE